MKKYKYSVWLPFEGKRYLIRADTEKELYEKRAARLQELKEGSRILSPSTTVDKWADTAYDTYKMNNSNLNEMKLRYKKYISPVIGPIPISKVSAVQCQNILNACSGMSFSHVDKLRQELRFIFETALDNELIRKNPAAKTKLPDYVKGERRSITDHERKHLYTCYAAYRPFILFILMLECGCRPSEAINLIGKDIDHDKRLLHIRGTKTANSDRYVPIPARLYNDIKDTKPFDYIAPNNAGRRHTEGSYTGYDQGFVAK